MVTQKDRGVKFVFKLARNLPSHSFLAQKWISPQCNKFVTLVSYKIILKKANYFDKIFGFLEKNHYLCIEGWGNQQS